MQMYVRHLVLLVLDEKELASVTYRVTTDVMHYAIHPQIDRDLAVH
jgi:hypothetical protein